VIDSRVSQLQPAKLQFVLGLAKLKQSVHLRMSN
jgi:hypothetical protein